RRRGVARRAIRDLHPLPAGRRGIGNVRRAHVHHAPIGCARRPRGEPRDSGETSGGGRSAGAGPAERLGTALDLRGGGDGGMRRVRVWGGPALALTLALLVMGCGAEPDDGADAQVTTRGSVEVTARLVDVPGEFPSNDLYDYAY